MKHINKQKTVVMAMSGGVDSSVAAALLKDQGFKVIGITLKPGDTMKFPNMNPAVVPLRPFTVPEMYLCNWIFRIILSISLIVLMKL